MCTALSGGGFRAAFAAVGALRLLADAGRLGELRYQSSVSGGSIASGLVATAWPAIREGGYTSRVFDSTVVEPLTRRVSDSSLKWALVRDLWETIGSRNRTDVLARHLDDWYQGMALKDLDAEVRWIFNAANLTNGLRFGFERDLIGDWNSGYVKTSETEVRLSLAVAASSAAPGAFSPVTLDYLDFPCAAYPPQLLDGGIYDNTGLQAIDGPKYGRTFLMAMNAGGLLQPGAVGRLPIVRDLKRSNAVLYRQSTALRSRAMVAQFELARRAEAEEPGAPPPGGARRGVLVMLASDLSTPASTSEALARWSTAFPEQRTYNGKELALYPTVLDKLDEGLCRALVYHAWWLVGAALATFHPHVLGEHFETWTPPWLVRCELSGPHQQVRD